MNLLSVLITSIVTLYAYTSNQIQDLLKPIAGPRLRCSFGMDCWPSLEQWIALNETLSGRLLDVYPPAAVCHDSRGLYDASKCAEAQAQWKNSFWRAAQPGATQDTYWEHGAERCYIEDARDVPCEQGLVPVIAADVRTVGDIQASLSFAEEHDLFVVIKNTGHDYLGRSSGAGAFSIWTHHLKGIDFHDSFVPRYCSQPGQRAVTVAAGEHWEDVYRAADKHRVFVLGGVAHSVGAAGGWILGGGHSALGPKYGLGVDNVLQFEIVTPDGVFRTASACSEPDLFWALRGGGGGTFGVVTSVTYKTHAPLHNIVAAYMLWNASNIVDLSSLSTRFLKHIPILADAGWSGYPRLSVFGGGALLVQPDSPFAPDVARGDTTWINLTFSHMYDLVEQHPETMSFEVGFGAFPSWWSFFNLIIKDVAIGMDVFVGSRLLTREVLEKRAEAVVGLAMDPLMDTLLCFVGGGVVNRPHPDATAVHPSWRKALVSLNFGNGAPTANISNTIKEALRSHITLKTQQLSLITGLNAGSYFNEADAREPRWQHVFWGSHYKELLAIKKKYDPSLLLTCNRCVGSEL